MESQESPEVYTFQVSGAKAVRLTEPFVASGNASDAFLLVYSGGELICTTHNSYVNEMNCPNVRYPKALKPELSYKVDVTVYYNGGDEPEPSFIFSVPEVLVGKVFKDELTGGLFLGPR